MIPRECKRLAEVDFPIAAVSKNAAREKSIRHGHPSTLHLWWARRPQASSRAVLLALLLPDPCDTHCPANFKVTARALLPRVGCGGDTDESLRQGLLKFIGDFSNWDLGAQPTYLEVARGLVKGAHPEETPLVVDPFAGGGSIPLEALRLGCDAFASDLNPVACMILKVMLEDIPRRGLELAEELRSISEGIKVQADRELAQFYPVDSDGAQPIAYFWARTVRCEAPNCGAEFPLVRTRWLSKRANSKVALKFVTERVGSQNEPRIRVEIFSPTGTENVAGATTERGKAVCPACHLPIIAKRLQEIFLAERGGTKPDFEPSGNRIGGARILAVLIRKPTTGERLYRAACDADYVAVRQAKEHVESLDRHEFPSEKINRVRPSPNARGLSAVTRYGIASFDDLYGYRQIASLAWLAKRISDVQQPATKRVLGAVLGRCVDYWNCAATWASSGEFVAHAFGRQALPMVWDFVEVAPFEKISGSLDSAIDWVCRVIETTSVITTPGQIQQADACASPLPDQTASIWFTDPPYYDSVPYADLSDFFYVWLRRAIPDLSLSSLLDEQDLTPKMLECVWNQSYVVDGQPKDGAFFEKKTAAAFAEGGRIVREDGVGCIVFAHKSTEGWEALLSGIIRGGWVLTGSWPIATERPGRLMSKDSAALATSVHLICRPRTEFYVGDWSHVLRELPLRVRDWMARLQSEHVRGADLVFACIGPALEIFSRYARVETAEGREVPLAEYLEKVWEVVGRSALEQVLGGSTGALEEDARLTALFLWTLQSSNGLAEGGGEDEEDVEDEEDGTPRKKNTGGFNLVFDVARRFAQPLGIHLPEWEGRVIEIEKGVVRLLPVSERAKQLFGEDGTRTAAAAFERNAATAPQMVLFPDEQEVVPKVKGRARKKTDGESEAGAGISAPTRREATTLDRVHAAMLLQRSGQANALRALLQAEQERGPDFLRLANALSALYPRDSEEKRLLDAMLLAVPR